MSAVPGRGDRAERLDALFACPLIHDLAADLGPLTRKRRRHPVALHLAFGAMARLYGSANRLDTEASNPQVWQSILERYNAGADAHPDGERCDAKHLPLIADTYRHVRDHLCGDSWLDAPGDAFTRRSVAIAQSIGLLNVDGGGSRTRPAPGRTIYGDGTVVRPMYAVNGTSTPKGRQDIDAEKHVRHDGPIWGNDLVTMAARRPDEHGRVILAVGRVHRKGREADTAVDLVRRVHRHAGEGIQAVVYDGAMRGRHHQILMSELGLMVVNKVHAATNKTGEARTYRHVPLGHWDHHPDGRTCRHLLVAHRGAVHDAVVDDSGTTTLSEPLQRTQVRRYERADGGWRFSLGVDVPCAAGGFVAWIAPHPQDGESDTGRPDQLRLLPEGDPYFQTLYGLRNDSEAINAAYKRTLVYDRAAGLGWRRQVLDLLSWSILTNTLAWHRHSTATGCPAIAS